MPGPLGRPLDTVRPEVSECSRIPRSRRPASRAATAWPPSWAMVTSIRLYGQTRRDEHQAESRPPPSSATTAADGAGWVETARRQISPISSKISRSSTTSRVRAAQRAADDHGHDHGDGQYRGQPDRVDVGRHRDRHQRPAAGQQEAQHRGQPADDEQRHDGRAQHQHHADLVHPARLGRHAERPERGPEAGEAGQRRPAQIGRHRHPEQVPFGGGLGWPPSG